MTKTKDKPRTTSDIDTEIGARIRMKRMMIGMSQEKLAEKIGLTFQQVQKYESARNRVAVSRIYSIAMALGCNINNLLPPIDGHADPTHDEMFALIAEPSMAVAMRALGRLSTKKRRSIIDLANSIAESDSP